MIKKNRKNENINQLLTNIQEKMERTEHRQMVKKKYSNIFFFITLLVIVIAILFAVFFFILPNTSNGNVTKITIEEIVNTEFENKLITQNCIDQLLEITPEIHKYC